MAGLRSGHVELTVWPFGDGEAREPRLGRPDRARDPAENRAMARADEELAGRVVLRRAAAGCGHTASKARYMLVWGCTTSAMSPEEGA